MTMTYPNHPDSSPAGGEVSVLEWLQDLADHHRPSQASPAMIPVAWIGRTSTEDKQDPTLSLPRQLDKARKALPPPFVIVAHFYDVESGRTDLALRGHGRVHEQFDIPIPRDGGIADALEEARTAGRRFVAVVCESVERIARVTYFGTKVEYELEQAGVPLLAADEGIDPDVVLRTGGRGPKKATSVLTRGGTSAKPPYGYRAERHPHPVKAKREEGATKSRLVPDPVRGPVVTQIFVWRALEHLSYAHIAQRLNTDPGRYPPPQPVRWESHDRAVGAWTPTSVREVLDNPKYTGYMVWNRRKRSRPERGVSGRINPPSEWVWSPQPTHEPLATRRLFDAAAPIGRLRQGSRSTPGANTAHPHTRRSYLLRSYLYCDLCGRRMFGKTRHKRGYDLTYYACITNPEHHRDQPWYPLHPRNLLVNQDQILPVVARFYRERIFGPQRKLYLTDPATTTTGGGGDPGREAGQATLRGKIAELEQAETNLWQQLDAFTPSGDGDLDRQWRTRLQQRFVQVAGERRTLLGQLQAMSSRPAAPVTNPHLLDRLPTVEFDLLTLPEHHQRRLFDAFGLELRYHRHQHRLALRATLRADTIQALQQALHTLTATPPAREGGTTTGADAPASAPRSVSHVLGTPAGLEPATVRWIRTEWPRDVGYRGRILAKPRGFRGVERAWC